MKRTLLPLMAAAAFTFIGTVGGSPEERTTAVLGIGNKSCGSWSQARHSIGMMSDMYEGWVAGFLSGANSVLATSEDHIDTLEQAEIDTDAQGLWAWVDNYCQAHPLNSVAQAADALGAELIRRAWKANRK
jgi:hypothetical protein